MPDICVILTMLGTSPAFCICFLFLSLTLGPPRIRLGGWHLTSMDPLTTAVDEEGTEERAPQDCPCLLDKGVNIVSHMASCSY